MSFSYRYLSGYGPTGRGANLSISIGGTTVYASPPLDRYNYSDPSDPPHTAYSPAVAAAATGLPLTVPAAGARIEVRVWNNDRNVQLLLPLAPLGLKLTVLGVRARHVKHNLRRVPLPLCLELLPKLHQPLVQPRVP